MLSAPTNESAILQLIEAIGPAAGAKKMITSEYNHAREAEASGIYITWTSRAAKDDCFRIGS